MPPLKLNVLLHTNGPALDPDRWPAETMERRRASSMPRVWRSLYQQDPTDMEGNLFREVWWQVYEPHELPTLTRCAVIVDSAYKAGVASDFSVCATWAKGVDGHVYLLDVTKMRAEFPDLVMMVHAAVQKVVDDPRSLPRPTVVIEDRASGQALVPLLRKPYTHPETNAILPPLNTFAWKHNLEGLRGTASKVARMDAVTPWIMAGKVHIPDGTHAWRSDWLDEHRSAPTGRNDDQVDTTVMALDYFLGARVMDMPVSGKLLDRDRLGRRGQPSLADQRVRSQRARREEQEAERWREMGLLEMPPR